jgi:hypothetical protein
MPIYIQERFYGLRHKISDFINSRRRLPRQKTFELLGKNTGRVGKPWRDDNIFLFWPNLFVSLVEGENDGLVTPESAAWTNFKGVLRGATRRGVSHADEVDARRMNFTRKAFENKISDIRNFYIGVTAGLKQMGL